MNRVVKYIICLLFLVTNLKCITAQISNALVLDGCSNYFEIPENDLLDYDELMSIECWIRPNCEDGNRIILSKQWCEGEYGYYLSVNNGRLFWSYSFTGECSIPNNYQSTDLNIVANQFTHVAVVHSQTEIKLFINGFEVLSEQNGGVFGEINNSSEPFRIGAYKNVSQAKTNYFSGLIDEIRLWNIELDETLIQERKDIPLVGDEMGLILYLDMEQVGQGATLTLENQSSFGAIFNAVPLGFTSFSPYIINYQEYDEYNIDLGDDIVTCDLPLEISIPNNSYKSILWSTGSDETEINVQNSGDYSVIVETELCRIFYDTINIELSNISIISNEFILCENDTVIINNIEYFEEGIFYDTLSFTGVDCDTILENSIIVIPQSENFILIESCPNSIVFYEGEELEVGEIASFIFTNSMGCDSLVQVQLTPTLVLNQEVNLITCEDTQIEYEGTFLDANSTSEFLYTSIEGCDSIVTVNVESTPPNNSFLGNDTIVCSSQLALFSPSENTLWNDETVANSITVNSTGSNSALYIDAFGCTNSDSVYVEFVNNDIYIPNIFTPNEDGINDCFKPSFVSNQIIEEYMFTIYNRWGEKVFETKDTSECWNGEFKGKPLNPAVYAWVIESININCNKIELLSGDVTLIK